MFKDAARLARDRSMHSFERELRKYAAKQESWFTGGPDSIDARLASCDRMIHSARSVLAADGRADTYKYLNALRRLKADKESLEDLREAMLSGAGDRRIVGFDTGESFGGNDAEGFTPDAESDAGIQTEPVSTGGHELVGSDHRWVALESQKFLANNRVDDREELFERAKRHARDELCHRNRADARTVGRSFVATVLRGWRPPRRTVTASTERTDFDSSMLFLG